MSTCVAELMAVLQRWPNGLTAAQVAEVLSIGRQTASNRLSRMAAYGHCEKLYPLHGHQVIYRARQDAAWLGSAGHGAARRGRARHGVARQGVARQDKARLRKLNNGEEACSTY
jgi:hypothetical protein